MNWTLFAIVSLALFFFMHYMLRIYIAGPIRLHHSFFGWTYVCLGMVVLNWPTAAVGAFLLAHHLIAEGSIF
jgi:hypothetical protein